MVIAVRSGTGETRWRWEVAARSAHAVRTLTCEIHWAVISQLASVWGASTMPLATTVNDVWNGIMETLSTAKIVNVRASLRCAAYRHTLQYYYSSTTTITTTTTTTTTFGQCCSLAVFRFFAIYKQWQLTVRVMVRVRDPQWCSATIRDPRHFLRSVPPLAFSLFVGPLPVGPPVTRSSSHPMVTPLVRVRVSTDCGSYFYIPNTRKIYFRMAKI